MKNPTQLHQPNHVWVERLRRARVPMFEEHQHESLPVAMFQTEVATLFRLDPLRNGFCIPVRCVTDVRGGVSLEGFEIEMPFGDFTLEPLEDPRALSGEPWYRFSGRGGREFHRDQVINHEFPGMLHRGPGWDGFLLGVLWGQLAETVSSPLDLRLLIFDNFNRSASTTISMLVERGMDYKPKPVNADKRKRLFEPAPEEGNNERRI